MQWALFFFVVLNFVEVLQAAYILDSFDVSLTASNENVRVEKAIIGLRVRDSVSLLENVEFALLIVGYFFEDQVPFDFLFVLLF